MKRVGCARKKMNCYVGRTLDANSDKQETMKSPFTSFKIIGSTAAASLVKNTFTMYYHLIGSFLSTHQSVSENLLNESHASQHHHPEHEPTLLFPSGICVLSL